MSVRGRRKPFDIESSDSSDRYDETITESPPVNKKPIEEIKKEQREILKNELGGNIRFRPKGEVAEEEENVIVEKKAQEEDHTTEEPIILGDDPEGMNELMDEMPDEMPDEFPDEGSNHQEADFNSLGGVAFTPEELLIGNMYNMHSFIFKMADVFLVRNGITKCEGLHEKLEMQQQQLVHAYRGVVRKYGSHQVMKKMADPVFNICLMSGAIVMNHIMENKA